MKEDSRILEKHLFLFKEGGYVTENSHWTQKAASNFPFSLAPWGTVSQYTAIVQKYKYPSLQVNVFVDYLTLPPPQTCNLNFLFG